MEWEANKTQIHRPLVERASSGDPAAQTELYQLYGRAMYNTAYRMIGNSTTAEDVMQEAFIQAFQALDRFNFDSTFGYWLKKIVINRSLNYLRKEKLILEKEREWREEVELQSGLDDQDNWSTEYSLQDIQKSLKELAPNHKLVFQLYMIEGYDHEEISEILKISASTSRSQLSRAKKNLKEILIHQFEKSNVRS